MTLPFAQVEPYILQSENGGRNSPVSPTGAKGYYQFLDSTWRTVPSSITQGYATADAAPFAVQQAAAQYKWEQNGGQDWLCPGCNAPFQRAYGQLAAGQTPDMQVSQTVWSLPLMQSSGGPTITPNTDPNADFTYNDPNNAGTGGTTTGSPGTGATGTPAGTGQPVNVGLQPSLVTDIGTWLKQAVTQPIEEYFASAQNWFQRAFIMVVGLILLLVAFWRLAEPKMPDWVKAVAKAA